MARVAHRTGTGSAADTAAGVTWSKRSHEKDADKCSHEDSPREVP